MNLSRRLMAVVVLALQGVAWPVAAEVVHYDNGQGDFVWVPLPRDDFNYFDPTQPPTQTGKQTPFGLTHTSLTPDTSTGIAVNYIAILESPPRIAIAVDDSFVVHGSEGGEATVTPATTFVPGETVGPDADWTNGADLCWITYFDGETSLLGDPPLIGFRTETNGQYLYGWIELGRGHNHQPIRWAYETELNTPIAVIPEPASIYLLLLCVLLVAASLRLVRPALFRNA